MWGADKIEMRTKRGWEWIIIPCFVVRAYLPSTHLVSPLYYRPYKNGGVWVVEAAVYSYEAREFIMCVGGEGGVCVTEICLTECVCGNPGSGRGEYWRWCGSIGERKLKIESYLVSHLDGYPLLGRFSVKIEWNMCM